MFTLQPHRDNKPAGGACRLASIFFAIFLLSLVSQRASADDYQTRIALPNSESTLGVNEVIFSWSTDETSGVVSVADGTVTDLSMKLDSSIAEFGGTFIDDILISGIVQPTGSTPPRSLSDITWEFDLDTGEVLGATNVLRTTGIPGVFFRLVYSSNAIFGSSLILIVFEDGAFDAFSFESVVDQRTALVDRKTVRDIPTPEGKGTIFDIDAFEQEGNVIESGVTNADFCVAPDPRETIVQEEGGYSADFDSRVLPVSELAGTGTCTGPLPVPDEDYATWEELLADIDLVVSERYRGFLGELRDGLFLKTEVWLTVGVVRSTAEFDGPVSVVGFPESGILYNNTPIGQRPACDNPKEYRNIDIGGAVGSFNEWLNVEGTVMIPQTVQCNRSWGMTRRTTHVYPLRIDYPDESTELEKLNVLDQVAGIDATLSEASACGNSDLVNALQASLDNAEQGILNDNFAAAVAAFEQLAIDANADDEFNSGGVTGFNSCPVEANYSGNFVSRGLTAAFTVFDRLINPLEFELYELPEELAGFKPDLR